MNREAKIELAKMQFLMERMDKPHTGRQIDAFNNTITENIDELDASDREDVGTNEFFDTVSKMKGGAKATIGYVSAAKLDYPMIKKKNPETNRMKNYPDFETFGKNIGVDGDIAGVIKFASYTLNWRSPNNMNKHYNANYVEPVNAIRSRYGLSPMEKRKGYTQTMDFGNGISAYAGANDEKMGHSYSPQDIGGKGVQKSVSYYVVDSQGNIGQEISAETLKDYFKKSSVSGVRDLIAMNKSDEEIKAYTKEILAVPFRYTQFEHSSVVYVITSINGERKRYFNTNLTNNIGGVMINPEQVISMAKKKYNVDNLENHEYGEFDDEYPDEA